MPDVHDDADGGDRIADNADVLKNAWQATLDDMEALAAEYEEEGWDTTAIPAGHTAAEHPDAGIEGRFGLAYVIPDNHAEAFETAFEAGEFPRYDVFRNEVGGQAFLVTVLVDPGTETAILLAGGFERRASRQLMHTASEAGEMYTHVQTLDGTQLGSFQHDDPEKFFPASDFAAAGG
jgi:hypothetical protein